MALYSLGMELEGSGDSKRGLYSPVEFMLYNASLVLWTGCIFCALIWVKIRLYRFYYRHMGRMEEYRSSGMEEQIRQTSAVGYSGVLFAWMVVASLEQTHTCPIPFLPNVCFQTYTLGEHLRFNFGPWVQLGVAQLILPRVSFLGHLSGILCGFVLHWRIFPAEVLASPQVLVPLVLLLHWRFVRGIVPLSYHVNAGTNTARWNLDLNYVEDDENDMEQDGGPSFRVSTSKRNLLDWTQKAQLVVSFISMLTLSWTSSLVMSQVLTSFICYYAVQASKNLETKSQSLRNTEQVGILLRGSFLSLLLLLISDCITLPRWITLRFYIQAESPNALNISTSIFVMTMRCICNGFMLFLTCGKLNNLEQLGGRYFRSTFGWIITSVVSISTAIVSKPTTAIFQGQGYTLGRR